MVVSKTKKLMLLRCIRYWEKEHKDLVKHGTEPYHHGEVCALCKYIKDNCDGCPIDIQSGEGCTRTPWKAWSKDQSNVRKHRAMITWMKKLYKKLTVK